MGDNNGESMEERRQEDKKIAVLEERVSNWMETTTSYRRDLCAKLDKVGIKLDDLVSVIGKLPCEPRKAWYQSMGRQVGFMWVVLGLVLVSVLGGSFIGITRTDQVKDIVNNIQSRVGINTQRVDKLDVMHNIVPR